MCCHIHSFNILFSKPKAPDLEFPGTELESTDDNHMEKKHEDLSNLIQQDNKFQDSNELADPNHVYHRRYVHKYNTTDNATGDNNQPRVTYPEKDKRNLVKRQEQQIKYFNDGARDLRELAEGDSSD